MRPVQELVVFPREKKKDGVRWRKGEREEKGLIVLLNALFEAEDSVRRMFSNLGEFSC